MDNILQDVSNHQTEAVPTVRPPVQKTQRPQADAGNPVLAAEVMEAIRTVRDPELPVNLVDLGLIYDLMVRMDGLVYIEMTLTTPACPVAGSLPGQVQAIVSLVPGVSVVLVNLVWSPPWTRDRMSETAKLELGLL